MAKNILIVGMPRSGTSMATAIFSRRGYFVAEDESTELREGDFYNPSGYFEAEQLIALNDSILSRAGFEPDNTWLFRQIQESEADNVFSVRVESADLDFLANYNEHSPWIWKDPRLCYTLAYWWPRMDQSSTRVVLLTRSTAQIYNSFLRLGWCNGTAQAKADVEERVRDHIDFARKTIAHFDIPHLEIDYSLFQSEPDVAANKLAAIAETELTPEDLGFDKDLNSSGLRGQVQMFADRLYDRLPAPVHKLAKNLLPNSLKAAFLGQRYKG